jgi:hypothetical protein
MSGRRAVTNLEKFLLLLREFGPLGAPRSQFDFDDVGPSTQVEHLFLAPTCGQLQYQSEKGSIDMNNPVATVLAFVPQTPVARQRAIAAIGGVAAAALVVVGVTSGVPHRAGSGQSQHALAQGQKGGPHLLPLDGPLSPRGASTGVAARRAAADGHGATGGPNGTGVHGSFSIFVDAAAGGPSPAGGSASSGAGSASGGSSGVPPLPSAPNLATTVLNPVTQLKGNVGGTVSTTVQQINAAAAAAAPITGVVNDVGTTVSGLSGMLVAPNA